MNEYEMDKEQTESDFIYDCNGQIIRYIMYMNDEDSSLGQIKTDQLISEYQVETGEGISVSVKEYEIEDRKRTDMWLNLNIEMHSIRLWRVIDKDEFDKDNKKFIFL